MRWMIMLCLWVLVVPSIAQDETECTPATGEPLRIGAVFSGGGMLMLQNAEPLQGAEAMTAAMNACGGVNGRPVELVTRTVETYNAAVIASQELIEEEGVPLIIGSGVLTVQEGIREVAEELGVPYWEVSEPLDGEAQWAFSPRPGAEQLGTGAALYINTELMPALALETPRIAVLYGSSPRGRAMADAVRRELTIAPEIYTEIDEDRYWQGTMADHLRDNDIDILVIVALDGTVDDLWYAMKREAADVEAFIHVGSEGFRWNLCDRLGLNEGIISVTAGGGINRTYLDETVDPYHHLYRREYTRLFSTEPSIRAELSAGGVYWLLRYVLPEVDTFTPEGIRDAIYSVQVSAPAGFTGDGLAFSPGSTVNAASSPVIQQRQEGAFCSLWPSDAASCASEVQPFPTWEDLRNDLLYPVCIDETI